MATLVDGNVLKPLTYAEVREGLIASGKSKFYADCMISMIEALGASEDIFNMRSYVNMTRIGDFVKSKARLADFICSKGGSSFIFFLVFVLVAVIGFCCCCFCFTDVCESRPQTEQTPHPARYLD